MTASAGNCPRCTRATTWATWIEAPLPDFPGEERPRQVRTCPACGWSDKVQEVPTG